MQTETTTERIQEDWIKLYVVNIYKKNNFFPVPLPVFEPVPF